MLELTQLIEECESIDNCWWAIRKSRTSGCYKAAVRIGDADVSAFRTCEDDPVTALRIALNQAKLYLVLSLKPK